VHYYGIDRAGDSTIAIGSCAASDKTSSAKKNGEQLEQLEQFNLLGAVCAQQTACLSERNETHETVTSKGLEIAHPTRGLPNASNAS
jgi:hypothetical protein